MTHRRAIAGQGGGAVPWWQSVPGCIAAWQPNGAASYSASLVNLANPGTYDAAPGVAPAWSAAGWVGNGSAYLRTGLIPSHPCTIIARGIITGGTSGAFMGARSSESSTDRLYVWPRDGTVRRYGYGGLSSPSGALSGGTMAVAGGYPYLDGAPDGAQIAGSPAGLSRGLVLMASDNGGTIIFPMTGLWIAGGVWNGTLTAGQIAALTAAMEAL